MRELSLFTGAGGGVLASKLLGWTTIGYIEYEPYCQQIIKQRIDDGILDAAPIFGDIRSFVSEGHAGAYTGMVDVVSAGFPCQPFSTAGKQQGADDERNMWPATLDVIRAVRPRFAFMENVPALVTSGYFGTILGGLAESGYDCRWRILSASELGAPHKRDRLWIVAYSAVAGPLPAAHRGIHSGEKRAGTRDGEPERPHQMADADGTGPQGVRTSGAIKGPPRLCNGTWWDEDPADVVDPEQQGKENREDSRSTQPDLGRVAHGVAHRVDRLKAIGNGQVPAVAALAWKLLTEGLDATP